MNQQVNPKNYLHFKPQSAKLPILKALLLLPLIACYTLFYLLINPYSEEKCIEDVPHNWLFGFNQLMRDKGVWSKIIMGIGQVCIDGWIVFMAVLWSAKINNFRYPVTIGLCFMVRAVLLELQKMPFPQYWIWQSPGFPSISVPYDRTRDFFYSGHTSFLLITFYQVFKLEWYKTSYICAVSLVFIIILILTCQAHYIIDVVGAFIYTRYLYQFVQQHLKKVDWLGSLPVLGGFKLYQKCKHWRTKSKDKNQDHQSQYQYTDSQTGQYNKLEEDNIYGMRAHPIKKDRIGNNKLYPQSVN